MIIGAEQYRKIVETAFAGMPSATAEPTGGAAYRDAISSHPLAPADAELVIAIAQLAVNADRVDDPDEQKLFDSIAGHVYGHARIQTAVPALSPIHDDDLRKDHLQTHAAQLKDKPAAGLAFALAYALTISDFQLAPEEGAMLEALREALGLDEGRAEELALAMGEALTPAE